MWQPHTCADRLVRQPQHIESRPGLSPSWAGDDVPHSLHVGQGCSIDPAGSARGMGRLLEARTPHPPILSLTHCPKGLPPHLVWPKGG